MGSLDIDMDCDLSCQPISLNLPLTSRISVLERLRDDFQLNSYPRKETTILPSSKVPDDELVMLNLK